MAINVKIENMAIQATRLMNFGAQVLNSGKATPQQFEVAKKVFGRLVMYAERPKPATISQAVYDNYCAAAQKLGKALVNFQGAVVGGGTGDGGYYSPPEEEEFVTVRNGAVDMEVEAEPGVDVELLPVEPVPAGEPPGFVDYVMESLSEHPLAWGAAALVAVGVGYTLGKRRTP